MGPPDVDVICVLEDRRREIIERFGVRSLSIFGSAARDELGPDSDIDVFVEFEGPANFDRFMGLKLYLEDVLGRPVDLVTPNALPDPLQSTVKREGRRVA